MARMSTPKITIDLREDDAEILLLVARDVRDDLDAPNERSERKRWARIVVALDSAIPNPCSRTETICH